MKRLFSLVYIDKMNHAHVSKLVHDVPGIVLRHGDLVQLHIF